MIFKEQFIPNMVLLELSLNIQMGFVLTVEQDVDGNFTIIPSGEVIDLGNGVFQIPD